MATVFIILLVLVAIYCATAPTREEEVARPIPQDASQEERELIQIKRKIDFLNGIALPVGSLREELIGRFIMAPVGVAILGFLLLALVAFSHPSSFSSETRLEILGWLVGGTAVLALWYYCGASAPSQLIKLKNRARFLENFLSAKRSGNYDEATLNEIKKALEYDLEHRNKTDLERLGNEMAEEIIRSRRR